MSPSAWVVSRMLGIPLDSRHPLQDASGERWSVEAGDALDVDGVEPALPRDERAIAAPVLMTESKDSSARIALNVLIPRATPAQSRGEM
jgi:hypothetical protein